MASSRAVLAPGSTPRQAPIRTHTLKRIVYPKPPRNLKVSLSAIYHTRADNERNEHKRKLTIASACFQLALRSLLALREPKRTPSEAKRAPRESKRPPREPQKTPKRVPRDPKRVPRGSQETPKRAP